MRVPKLLTVTALSAAVLVPSALLAAVRDTRPPCILNGYQVTSVKPYKVTERIGRGSFVRARGAQAYVAAQPGLTAEWLEFRLEQHARKMSSTNMKDCVFDLSEVRIDVVSAGPGFWVRFVANDPGKAEEVLRRARLQLVGG